MWERLFLEGIGEKLERLVRMLGDNQDENAWDEIRVRKQATQTFEERGTRTIMVEVTVRGR